MHNTKSWNMFVYTTNTLVKFSHHYFIFHFDIGRNKKKTTEFAILAKLWKFMGIWDKRIHFNLSNIKWHPCPLNNHILWPKMSKSHMRCQYAVVFDISMLTKLKWVHLMTTFLNKVDPFNGQKRIVDIFIDDSEWCMSIGSNNWYSNHILPHHALRWYNYADIFQLFNGLHAF